MNKDYSLLDDVNLFQQYKRITNNLKNVTLKKLQLVMEQYNQQRLRLSQILIQLDKRGHVNRAGADKVVAVPVQAKKYENSNKTR